MYFCTSCSNCSTYWSSALESTCLANLVKTGMDSASKYTSWKYGSKYPSNGMMLPSGASQVASSILLAFTTCLRTVSATTQSSLHQPGSCAACSQVIARGCPSVSSKAITPLPTSSLFHEMGEPLGSF